MQAAKKLARGVGAKFDAKPSASRGRRSIAVSERRVAHHNCPCNVGTAFGTQNMAVSLLKVVGCG